MLKNLKTLSPWLYLLQVLLLASGYFIAGQASFSLSVTHNIVTLVVFAPEGFALAAVILLGKRLWLGVFLGQLLLALYNHLSVELALDIACINSFEAVLGGLLFKRFALNSHLSRLRDVLGLWLLIFGVLQPFSATLGNLLLWQGGVISDENLLNAWLSWWFGNSLGQLLITPLLLCFAQRKADSFKNILAQTQWLLLILIPINIIAFFSVSFSSNTLVAAITTLLLTFIAAKSDMFMVTLGAVLIAVTTLFFTKLQIANHLISLDSELLFDLNVHLLGTALIGQFVSVLLTEHQQALNNQREALNRLEKISSRIPGMVYQYRLNADNSSCFPYSSFAIEEIYGLRPEQVQHDASAIFGILHADDYQKIVNSIIQSAKELTPWQLEYRICLENGTERWLWGNAVPEREEDGAILWHGFITDITERKRTEQQLQQNEMRFKNTFENAPIGIVNFNRQGRFIAVNQTFCDFVYYSRAELLTMSVADVSIKEEANDNLILIERLFAGEIKRFSFEKQYLRRDGKLIWGSLSVRLNYDLNGHADYTIGTIENIHERKKAEVALRDSEQQLKLVLEGGHLGFWDWNIDTGQVQRNAIWAKMLGYTNEELQQLSKNWLDFIHSDDRDKVWESIYNVIAGNNAVHELEYRLLHKSGAIRWVLDRARVVQYDAQGKALRMSGTHTDITHLKHLEEQLRSSQTFFQLLTEISPVGIYQTNTTGECIFVNPRWCAIAGMSAPQALGLGWQAAIMEEDRPKVIQEWHDSFNEQRHFSLEYRFQKADGAIIWVQGLSTIIYDELGHNNGYIGTITDITQLKLMELNLRSSEAKFRSIIEISLVPMALTDMQQSISFINSAFIKTYGYDLNDLKTVDDWWRNAYPDPVYRQQSIDKWYNAIETAQKTGQSAAPEEYKLRCKDGSEKIALVNAVAITDSSSNEYVVVFYDISQLKQIQQDLINKQNQLQNIIQGTNAGTWEWAVQTGKVTFNERWAEIAGYHLDELQPLSIKTWQALCHPDDLKHSQQLLQKHFAAELAYYDCECRVKHKQGHWVWVLDRGQVITRNKAGLPTLMAGTHIDISHLKQNEAQLRIAATVFESAEGMIITNAQGIILNVNQAFCTITGYSSTEVIGQSPFLLDSQRHDKYFYQTVWQHINDTGSWQGEMWHKRKNGEIFPEWLTITAVKTNNDNIITHYVATLNDITERKMTEEHIHQLAFYDSLTQLPNRRLLQERLKHGIDLSRRNGSQMAILMLDLDKFKAVNDTLGHTAGDELLKQVGERIKKCLRQVDTVARLGGDEFVILMQNINHYKNIACKAKIIIHQLSQAFYLADNHIVHIGASIGIAIYPTHGQSAELLMDNADTALYHAKDQGRGCFAYFSEELTQFAKARLALEADLRRAIIEKKFCVYYQPQVSLKTGKIVGAEALVRWQHPTKGFITPKDFIPLAEETGLIAEIGQFVLEQTCQLGRQWLDAGLTPITLAVNVSPYQFRRHDINTLVAQLLTQSQFPAQYLELEITETGLMDNQEYALTILNNLHQQGIKLAIDDFGTGYSSLAYLKYFPLDVLKIDKTFIDDIPFSEGDMAITSSIIAMAHHLGFKVLAEGVETQAQLTFLQQQGCDIYQGYLCSKPVPAAVFFELLTNESRFKSN